MNPIKFCYDDVISDVTADQFRLEFSTFRACEYNNLISLHLMFTRLDMIYNQLVLTNHFKFRHGDVTADQFRLDFSIFRTCEYNNLISLHPIFTKLDI